MIIRQHVYAIVSLVAMVGLLLPTARFASAGDNGFALHDAPVFEVGA